ncbi:TonB-dependent receptor [Porticoccus sp. W117]|uniref:TonB-dependent receptor n=1 Tax=Porticoccus sp. W117 TaxID=3054777 RepID=UPI00259A3FAF|nr:TonB-dependent receptor [Porticoccus sp. W117]MDM3871598.1 TonB-dependent receptor [Porticoccus sp. W117]
MKHVHKPLYSAMLLAGAACAVPNAYADVLEEVVVTAQKRAQSVNSIGVSANAFSGNQLSDLGVDNAVDLGAVTPGLIAVNVTSGGTPVFAIRGIGLDDFSPNNTSGVGVYTDEVFASNPAFLGGQLFDVERVEVLKGPQGTLYGKNTTGGAINFISNKPTDEFEGSFEASYGRFNTLEMTGVVSGALSDTVRGRLSANFIDSDGWQTDVATGQEFGSDERFAIRGILDFDLGETGSAMLKVYHSQDSSKPVSPDVQGLGDFFGDPSFDALNSPSDPSLVTAGDLIVDRDEDGSGVSLHLQYEMENFDFISISALDQYDRQVVDNYGGSAAAILDLFQDNEMDQWSQEFRLVSNGDGDFTWVAGVNVSNEEVTVVDTFDDSYLVTDSTNISFVFDPADVAEQGLDLLTGDYVQETDSYGLYLHTETQLNDVLKLTVGARYSYDDRSFNGVATNSDAAGSFNDVITSLNESQTDSAFTGKVGLDWNASEDVLVYGSVSTSYKSGTYYGAAVLDDVGWAYVDPEDVTAFEVGFKATLLDGAMQFNGAAFMLDYEDRQSLISLVVDDFSNFLGFPVVDTTLVNVPESESRGFELDLTWAATDQLSIVAGVGYLDSEVTRAPTAADMRGINPDPSVNDQATIDGTGFVDALAGPLTAGSVLSQAPEWSYNGLVAYEIPLDDEMSITLQTSYSRVDSQVAQLADANAEYGPVKSLDAQITLEQVDGSWEVALFGKNITDNDSETYSFSSFAGRSVYRQKPATYGVKFKYLFQ